jgi:hypothetical protein
MPAHAVGVAVSVLLTSDIDRRGLGTFSAANSASSPDRVIGDIGAGDDDFQALLHRVAWLSCQIPGKASRVRYMKVPQALFGQASGGSAKWRFADHVTAKLHRHCVSRHVPAECLFHTVHGDTFPRVHQLNHEEEGPERQRTCRMRRAC